MDPTTILIVNIHSSKNSGDRALLETTIQQLEQNFENPEIILSPNWPQEDYFQESGYEVVPSPWDLVGLNDKKLIQQLLLFLVGIVKSLFARVTPPNKQANLTKWEQLFAAYRIADLVVAVAGNQFYSTGRYGWPFPVNLQAVWLANKFKKPFYSMPQSIGPLRRGWERALIKHVYGNAQLIHVRDSLSYELMKALSIPINKVFLTPDPAFDFKPAPRDEAIRILEKYGYSNDEISIGVSIIGSMGRSLEPGAVFNYYSMLANGLRKFIALRKIKVYLFNQVTGPTKVEDDRLGTSAVAELLSDITGRVVNVNEVLSPSTLKGCYGLMDFYVASRLHSGIFAISMNVPTLFIGYLSKTRGVLRSIDLEKNVIDIEDITSDKFYESLSQLWENRQETKAHLCRIMPRIIAETHTAGKRIAEDYYSHVRSN